MSEKEKDDSKPRLEAGERKVAARNDPQALDDSERRLARAVGIGIPIVTLVISIGVGTVTSLGPAILVFVAGALLGTITLIWASLRTLGGDAPLPTGLATAALISRDDREVAERKRTVLLALKDLEHERAIGKIDEADYQIVAERYRTEAKNILREIDDEAAPNRSRAEQLARTHLKRRGLLVADAEKDDVAQRVSIEPAPPTTKSAPPPPMPKEARRECEKCQTSNEPDAAFCKKCGASLVKIDEAAEEKSARDADESTEKQA